MKNKKKYFLSKLKSYSLKDLIWMEMESYITWLFRSFPGAIGCSFRYLLYKILFKKLTSFCVIQPNVFFINCRNIKCGRNFAVNSNTYINAIGGVDIGDNVLLGPNVVISTGEHQYSEGKLAVTLQLIIKKNIKIGNGVWVGANVVIMPGVTLAEGTIVGAGAIVTRSTKPYSVVVGIPAKKIKSRL